MKKAGPDQAPADNGRWVLIRGARQLLTLRGASGPRRGPAMADLNIIQDGAVLIRDGIIEEVGTTRRVENLVPARLAREIDAAGKVVMPAFVDPDVALAAPVSGVLAGTDGTRAGSAGPKTGGSAAEFPRRRSEFEEPDIRRMSRRRLEGQAADMAAELARYGVLTVGAHTGSAPDLQNTYKALRLHQAMQAKPLRIRSIFAPPWEPGSGSHGASQRRSVAETWMPSVFRKKLSSLLEIPVADPGRIEDFRFMAEAAAAIGYNIRFRVPGPTTAAILDLAYSAGAIALIGPVSAVSRVTRSLGDAGCIKIILNTRLLAGDYTSKRRAVDDGTPFALASGYAHDRAASLNPQLFLYMACAALKMTAEEAIVCTTYNAACSLRLSHVTGSLAPGKSADLCIMDVDDYRELPRRAGHHDVCLVMRAGKVIYRRPNPVLD